MLSTAWGQAILKTILGIVGGLVLAFAIVFATDYLFHLLSPTAARPEASDAEAMRTYVASQPPATLIALVAGWALAAFAGAALATRIANRGTWPGWVVTGLFLLATSGNFLMVPHPGWMMALAVALIVASGWLGVRLAKLAARRSGT